MLPKLGRFLKENKLCLISQLGKGHSSQIFLVQGKRGKKFVAKIERQDSTRFRMAERESENLSLANSIGIGPKLFAADLKKRIVLMEFIEGPSFAEWLFSGPSQKALKEFIKELQAQAKALDKAGLDHGQLAGKGKNILVKKGKTGKGCIESGRAKPAIIDFEKASQNRKCHNLSTIESFLFKNPRGAVAKKVREILG
jgi:putative serine/threonine protein kinase